MQKATIIKVVNIHKNKSSRIISIGNPDAFESINSNTLFKGSCMHIITRLFRPIQQNNIDKYLDFSKILEADNTNILPMMAKP